MSRRFIFKNFSKFLNSDLNSILLINGLSFLIPIELLLKSFIFFVDKCIKATVFPTSQQFLRDKLFLLFPVKNETIQAVLFLSLIKKCPFLFFKGLGQIILRELN